MFFDSTINEAGLNSLIESSAPDHGLIDTDRPIRLGAYGDPFAIPPDVWGDLFRRRYGPDKHLTLPKKQTGFVLYDGPGMLGQDILVLANTLTNVVKNEKIGQMGQVWILLKDIEPHLAKGKQLYGVCGNCSFRHDRPKGGICYVRRHEAPLSIHRAWQRGSYNTDQALGRAIVSRMIQQNGHTGYSESAIRHLNSRDMATQEHATQVAIRVSLSAKSPKEAARLQAKGFQTFRPVRSVNELMDGEELCAADRKGIAKMDCATCKQCDGSASNKSHGVLVHGNKAASANKSLYTIGG